MIKYTKKEIEQFKKERCPRCILAGRCIEEGRDEHWFAACPHFFNWKHQYSNWLIDQLEWKRRVNQ